MIQPRLIAVKSSHAHGFLKLSEVNKMGSNRDRRWPSDGAPAPVARSCGVECIGIAEHALPT
ncbi:hypothetical protein BDN72DRAFT_836880 [Pluteus cervinus]|uniref:Uncharacterized protein n=1 Tax=Pluteus cervinus TaxID=181527 RepID=A0ACD3B1V6_9AGAR|nr:hypothetical protein BDN72DRAFT_836880 [Pluteus cervinus]